MVRYLRFDASKKALSALAFAVALGIPLALAPAANLRVRLEPRLTAGESLRYQLETQITTTGKTTSPIANPEGGSKSTESISLLVRLDVLAVKPVPAGSIAAPVQVRVTFEKSSAESQTDAFNPAAPSIEERYSKLEGRSVEATILPDGEVTDLDGLEDIFPKPSADAPILFWAQVLFAAARVPREGLVIGQKWSEEHRFSDTPLTGVLWRSESSYLRDEPCHPSPGPSASLSRESCAVLLNRFEIFRHGSPHADATPDDYRRNGLRTAGAWTGGGQSLDSISLGSSLVVNSTQTSTQKMDYEIISVRSGSRIHHVSDVNSRSHIQLIAPAN